MNNPKLPSSLLSFALFRWSLLIALMLFAKPLYAQVGQTLFVNSYLGFEDWNVNSPGYFYTDNKTFRVQFGEQIPYTGNNYPTTANLTISSNSAIWSGFTSSVMRALNTIEKTFANTQSRTMNVKCVFHVASGNVASAEALPDYYNTTYTYTANDLGGKATGKAAYVNNVEYIWKYQKWHNGSIYTDDVVINFYSPTVDYSGFYMQEDTASYTNGLLDLETVTLHEMGHALGFITKKNSSVAGETAYEILTEAVASTLPGGGTEYYFGGETATYVNGGDKVQLMYGAYGPDVHVLKPKDSLMLDGTQSLGTKRAYSQIDLAMFQDMGWTLTNPIVIPEPSFFGLLASFLALGLVATRRNRKRLR